MRDAPPHSLSPAEARNQLISLSGGYGFRVFSGRILGGTIVQTPMSTDLPSEFIENPCVRHPIARTYQDIPRDIFDFISAIDYHHNLFDRAATVYPTLDPDITIPIRNINENYERKNPDGKIFLNQREALLALQLARAKEYVAELNLTATERAQALETLREKLLYDIEHDYHIDDLRMETADSLVISQRGLIKLQKFQREVLRAIHWALDSSFYYRGKDFHQRELRFYDAKIGESLTEVNSLQPEVLDCARNYEGGSSALRTAVKKLLLDTVLEGKTFDCMAVTDRARAAQNLLDIATGQKPATESTTSESADS